MDRLQTRRWLYFWIVSICLAILIALPGVPGRPASQELRLAQMVEDWGGRVTISNGLLRGIDLSKTRVSDDDLHFLRAAMLELRHPSSVREISLSDLDITDKGVENLSGLRLDQLTLRLNRTKVSDRALEYIAHDFGGLRELVLIDTMVTESGLARLVEHPTLAYVEVSGPNVTKCVVARLNQMRSGGSNVAFRFNSRERKKGSEKRG